MKLQTFFERFDQLADAPDAVTKMKELVLNLAIQGRLVSNCAENPISVDQIAAEKQQRLRELSLRSHPETAFPTDSDFRFSLPKSWHRVTLGDLAFSCPTSYGEDPIPSLPKAGVVKVGNIDNQGGFKGQFSERGFPADEIGSLLARRGDLMVVKSSGSAENVHSGKTALCTGEHDGKIVGSNFVLRLRLLGTPALPEYIWRVLTSRYSRAWVEGRVQTMTYPNLKWSDFARLPIPLPPLSEQKRIVSKVDELMALCNRLEAQQQEREERHAVLSRASLARFAHSPKPANLLFLFHPSYTIPPSDLRKSILTLAVQGKLLPQDPNDESASKLVSRNALSRESGAPYDLETLERPFVVPETWCWVRLADFVESMSNGIYKPAKFYSETGTACVRMFNIQDGRLDLNKLKRLDLTSVEVEQYRLEVGDLLVNRVNSRELVGKCAVVETSEEPLVFEAMNIRVRLTERRDLPSYVNLVLRTERIRDLFQNTSKQAIGQASINQRQLAGIAIPIPPLAEQRRIVAKVAQLMALVDELETQLVAYRAAAAHLLEALVAQLTTTSYIQSEGSRR